MGHGAVQHHDSLSGGEPAAVVGHRTGQRGVHDLGCRARAARQTLTSAGVSPPITFLPPPFRGFFALPPAPEFPEQPGFLQLPFQETQSQLHIVVMHRDGEHGRHLRQYKRLFCDLRHKVTHTDLLLFFHHTLLTLRP
jgi:hypothetical protein